LRCESEKDVVDSPVAVAFRRHYEQVYRFLRRRTESDEVAEDLAQAVFADAATRLRRLEHDDPPILAWLYTVARRRLVDRARAAARAQGTLASLDEARAQPIEATLEYGTQLGALIGASIRELPEGQRQVVVMKLLEGRPFAEIAERLGVTEAACKMRFSRGLGFLRSELSRRGVEPR
jgi:RNA polymerase sigma-70 factor, ECF subfamily